MTTPTAERRRSLGQHLARSPPSLPLPSPTISALALPSRPPLSSSSPFLSPETVHYQLGLPGPHSPLSSRLPHWGTSSPTRPWPCPGTAAPIVCLHIRIIFWEARCWLVCRWPLGLC